ncbi:small multi-drug export protein [Gracilibacillus thailandensis]|jgi:Ca2+/H+ antiporter, TMEM165/GDT1 family|uniref:DNA-binding protein n=1 Tax=Gracilibacillus thailandensis TaxID=563735 RepID=A0A6N7QZJ4_9BACI|nr:small multi-drug export protein [Gracilibacillus thailandensis]MRI66924.1 DNA-binding protein [Gracilibacillus thailandensis]
MEFMELIWAYILVFLLAAIPFVEAVYLTPIAVVAGLSPVPTFILAVLGNLITVYFVILFINKIKQWRRKKKQQSNKKATKAENIWKKYGLPGLTLIGPFLIGSHLSAFLCLVFGGTKRQVTVWMTISIVGWSLLLGILAALGFEFMNVENPFIERFFEEQ